MRPSKEVTGGREARPPIQTAWRDMYTVPRDTGREWGLLLSAMCPPDSYGQSGVVWSSWKSTNRQLLSRPDTYISMDLKIILTILFD